MINSRYYGNPPYNVVLVHGGPGAMGEMAPVARVLEDDFGLLEPLQTQTTLEGQVDELVAILSRAADLPVFLVGFSWGAWLSYVVTARFPTMVTKLILVGSGPFKDHYVARIQIARMSRLSEREQVEYNHILAVLNNPEAAERAEKFARLGQLASKADHYDPGPDDLREGDMPTLGEQGNVFYSVLGEAQEMRKSGVLLDLADHICCPVVAIHGDYDPHPAAGVFEPLKIRLQDFRLISIDHCGHKPWIERQAKEQFYEILRVELHVAQSASPI